MVSISHAYCGTYGLIFHISCAKFAYDSTSRSLPKREDASSWQSATRSFSQKHLAELTFTLDAFITSRRRIVLPQVCVCVFVCVCVCIFRCANALRMRERSIYIHTYINTYIHTYVCMYVCMYIWYIIIALVALNLEKLLLFVLYLAVQLASKLAETQLIIFEA